MELTWRDGRFEQLTAGELYGMLALRARVFVVEQRCAYLDVDGLDLAARHVWAEQRGWVVAYARILPAGLKYAEVAIGRVVVAAEHRTGGVGRELMTRTIALAGESAAIRLSAQAHLEKFYGTLGFTRVGDVYDEDGIPHVEMVRSGS